MVKKIEQNLNSSNNFEPPKTPSNFTKLIEFFKRIFTENSDSTTKNYSFSKLESETINPITKKISNIFLGAKTSIINMKNIQFSSEKRPTLEHNLLQMGRDIKGTMEFTLNDKEINFQKMKEEYSTYTDQEHLDKINFTLSNLNPNTCKEFREMFKTSKNILENKIKGIDPNKEEQTHLYETFSIIEIKRQLDAMYGDDEISKKTITDIANQSLTTRIGDDLSRKTKDTLISEFDPNSQKIKVREHEIIYESPISITRIEESGLGMVKEGPFEAKISIPFSRGATLFNPELRIKGLPNDLKNIVENSD